MSPWPNYSITIIQIGKLMQVTSSIKTLNSSTTKKCKCSSEIQTRAANPHTPSSDKSLKVSIRDQCDRGKTKQDTRPSAQKWNVGLEHRKERETFCGCFRKRTPFLRGRVQLQGCEPIFYPQTLFNLLHQKIPTSVGIFPYLIPNAIRA